MRIAVAGATGLVGAAAARALEAAGHSILRIGRGPGNDLRIDLARPSPWPAEALAGCCAFVHAAGVTDEDFADRALAYAKALEGARALIAAAASAGIGAFAYVSSAHVYGPLEGPIDERCPPNPLSDYALAHFCTEQLFRRAAGASGAAVLVLRPCAVFGMPPRLERFGRWSLIPFEFPRQAVAGRIVLRSTGIQRRNFIASEALGDRVARWIAQGPEGMILDNAPGREEMSVYDFARLCAKIAAEETGRGCLIERPEAGAVAAAPLEYRSIFGAGLAGTPLEQHVRSLVRALSKKASS